MSTPFLEEAEEEREEEQKGEEPHQEQGQEERKKNPDKNKSRAQHPKNKLKHTVRLELLFALSNHCYSALFALWLPRQRALESKAAANLGWGGRRQVEAEGWPGLLARSSSQKKRRKLWTR